MKMNKKKLLSLALVALLIGILSFGTLAWFNDSEAVTNTFMMANSAETPDEVFSVDVWEYVNGDTETKVGEGESTVGETYKDILPGSRLQKEPYIQNTGSYDQYIRVHVTITNAKAWMDALAKYNITDLGDLFEGHDETAWTRYEAGVYNGTENTYTMTFYLNYKLEPGNTACLFNTVVIPTQLDQNDMTFVGGKFELTILAEAVQTENLGEDVDSAYEAFQKVTVEN